jgi:NAD(P)-dependent dehydrogenase (short-subunit alcohol dehydrogenase family)
MHFEDVSLRKHYNCLLAYKQSKLANVLFANELKKRLGKASNIGSFAFDPGLVNTEMGLKNTAGIAKFVWSIRKNSGDDPSVAAESLAYLVFDESLKNCDDVYFKAGKAKKASHHALNADSGKRLWAMSEKMCGVQSVVYGL